MKKKQGCRKRLAPWLGVWLLLVSLCTFAAQAADPGDDLATELQNGDVTITQSGSYTLSAGNYVHGITVADGVTCALTITDAMITPPAAPAINVQAGGTLELTVAGNNTLTGAPGYAGICVEPAYTGSTVNFDTSAKLTILGSGTLIAQGGAGADGWTYGGGAGIGGNGQDLPGNGVDFGTITVAQSFSGTINATGGAAYNNQNFGGIGFGGGAGIGSGGFNMTLPPSSPSYAWYETQGRIVIQGGTINANPNCADVAVGAGIGSGAARGNGTSESSVEITITGGTVNAQGGTLGAGIGGGNICDGGIISITGGTVNAVAGNGEPNEPLGGAGIGGGDDGSVLSISITGGTVTATAGGGAAGIGGGADTFFSYIHESGQQSSITISGLDTQVTAYGGTASGTGNRMYGGAGIGSGYVGIAQDYEVRFDISIGYGATATAYGGYHAEAIGYGYHPPGSGTFPGAPGFGIHLTLDDTITLWAVNMDYYKPALVVEEEYYGGELTYGAVSYVSDAVYLVQYTDAERTGTDITGDVNAGTAVGSLQAAKEGGQYPEDATLDWSYDAAAKLMTMTFVSPDYGTFPPLDTPFGEGEPAPYNTLHGNWATLYPAAISVRYEFVNDPPAGVTPPDPDFILKGSAYDQKAQTPSSGDGLVFDGWYTDSSCTQRYVDGTVLNEDTVLYGRWLPEGATGTLTVTKTVTGTGGDPNQDFDFTVTINGTTAEQRTFTLRDGQSTTLEDLPVGAGYTVVEEQADQDGYVTTITNGTGTITVEGTTVSVINHRDGTAPTASPPPTAPPATTPPPDSIPATGDGAPLWAWWMLALGSGLGMAACFGGRRLINKL